MKIKLIRIRKVSILLIFLFLVVCIKNFAQQSNNISSNNKEISKIKDKLLQKEISLGVKNLIITGTMSENKVKTHSADFFHHTEYKSDGYLIKGLIKNNATLAVFKDAVISVNFYSPTSSKMNTKTFTIYQFYKPQSSVQFEYKIEPPEGFSEWDLHITGISTTYSNN